jgi:hypothetical protein
MDLDQSFDLFVFNIRAGLTAAWHRGMRSVGLQPVDMTPQERIELAQIIQNETSRVFPFLIDVEQNSKANGGKLGPHTTRVNTWANRFPDVENRARLVAQNDPKLEWQINVVRQVEHNCNTCLRLNGKVKRASAWQRADLHPQNPPNPHLECEGWLCGCALLPSDKPLSRGPLPRV